MQAEQTRYRIDLSISGTAVIAFGAWDIIKSIVFLLIDPLRQFELLHISESVIGTEQELAARIAAFIIVLVTLGTMLLLRTYIGLSARAESRGKRKSKAYLVVAICLTVFELLTVIPTFRSNPLRSSLPGVLSGILIQLSSLMAYFDLIITSIRVKRLNKISTPE